MLASKKDKSGFELNSTALLLPEMSSVSELAVFLGSGQPNCIAIRGWHRKCCRRHNMHISSPSHSLSKPFWAETAMHRVFTVGDIKRIEKP